jgi:hypothetical protein
MSEPHAAPHASEHTDKQSSTACDEQHRMRPGMLLSHLMLLYLFIFSSSET